MSEQKVELTSEDTANGFSIFMRRFISPLLVLFCVLWVAEGFLKFWAIQNGYLEVWSEWTIADTWASPVLTLATVGLVVVLVRWVKHTIPEMAFIFLAVSNILIGTVLAANVVTLVGGT